MTNAHTVPIGDYLVPSGLTTTCGGAGSSVFTLWYEGVRIYPPELPTLTTKEEMKVAIEVLRSKGIFDAPLLPIPRNRAELRAWKSQQRKKKR
jgi:hypothetical protein